ncbi:hypothetical protein IWQ56_004518 [Coemansia nantahalensis]|nr:hypothetical protein IWQ56_004518 [Coemansia nantahalensis]
MADDQAAHMGVGQRLVWILQYLNPLFYARLAQSLVSSVFHSHQIADSSSAGGSTACQSSAPVPTDAMAIDCGYMDAAGGIAHSYQHTALPQLDLGPADLPIEPRIAEPHAVETHAVEPRAAEIPGHIAETGSGMFEAAGMVGLVEEADGGGAGAQDSSVVEPEATPDATPVIGDAEPKAAKKGKRGKSKNKGKAAGPAPA